MSQKLPKIPDNSEKRVSASRLRAQTHHSQHKLSQTDLNKTNNFKQLPFKLPTDNEVFDYCEKEKIKKREYKQSLEKKDLHEKFTLATKIPLMQYKSFDKHASINEKHVTKTQYRGDDKTRIQEAMEYVKERKSRDVSRKKEPVTQVLDQKKEMFLVTMAHGIIEQEIDKLKKICEDKSKALDQSLVMLTQDQENFDKYKDLNEKQRIEAEDKADKMSKLRRENELIVKQLSNELTQLKADKVRNEEILTQYKEHKLFLNNISNKDWLDQFEKSRQVFIEQFKQKWTQNQLKESSSKFQVKKALSTQVAELEKRYAKLVELNEIDEIIQFQDNQDIYFKDPNQLADYFNMLEEKNLLLIQNCQEEAQRHQELKNKFKEDSNILNEKSRVLQQTNEEQKLKIDKITEEIKALRKKRDFNGGIIKDETSDLNKIINEMYLAFIGEQYVPQYRDSINQKDTEINSKDLLTQVEIHLENQINQIRELCEQTPNILRDQQKRAENERKSIMRKEQLKKINEDQLIKDKKNIDKIMLPTRKREGRIVMMRSAPIQKQILEIQKIEDNCEEEDKKYFRPEFQLNYSEKE